ncbi:MAG: retropepsin-like aspartic protease [Candidatus Omnitrophota bacterium]|nr:retropepsin-like aspartic protease [Candidatus Omnitrophota bacterium]
MIFYRRCKFCGIILALMFLNGCTVLNVAGTAGKVVYTTAKVAGKAVCMTAKVAGKTAVATGKSVRTVVNMATGKHVVKLVKRGNSLTASVLLNRKVREELIVDTGATDTVISSNLARKIGVSPGKGKNVLCQVADGRTVNGKQVKIKEVRVGGAKVYNVQAIVLDSGETGNSPGLLGMSFLNNFVFKVDTEKETLVLQKR